MAEKKLSEELRNCLDGDGCKDCESWNPKIKVTCEGLLQKAYEVVRRYEEMFPCKVGDKLYHVGKEPRRIREFTVFNLLIVKDNVIIETEEEINFESKHIGKDFFLTKEAAEKALKEMEDRKNGEIDQ